MQQVWKHLCPSELQALVLSELDSFLSKNGSNIYLLFLQVMEKLSRNFGNVLYPSKMSNSSDMYDRQLFWPWNLEISGNAKKTTYRPRVNRRPPPIKDPRPL